MKKTAELQICSRCVLDTTAPDIWFDKRGVCKYCKIHNELEKAYPKGADGERRIHEIAGKIKKKGKNRKYDCLVGVSGGRDSTYTLYLAVNLGLRPLAVHFDNGWDSSIAVSNIKNATDKLEVDLHTIVADWEEFKDLQISFLKASVPDAEIPTDYAIYSVLFQVAAHEGIKYILEGHSFRTEGTSPLSWTYMDGRYIKSVHKKFGRRKLTSFPVLTFSKLFYFLFVRRIKYVRPLESIDYRQDEVNTILETELGWRYYGGHHHESVYTQFFQSYLLPRKFGIDKRKTEYSALIRSGQMPRESALKEIAENTYPVDQEIVNYVISKLGLSKEEFHQILSAEKKSFQDYPTYMPFIRILRLPIKLACKLRLLPQILLLKYAS
jgi:N-acetyl sugar amidotransferase